MNLHNPATDLPAANSLPTLAPAEAPGTPAQLAFREAVQQVEGLRQRLRDLQVEQGEARRRYWQQVGPGARAVVEARRALFAPLENALLLPYFSRAEERQITEFILGNARALHNRFGEDTAEIVLKYAPRRQATVETEDATADEKPAAFVPDLNSDLPPHEQAAAHARARRKTKAQKTQEIAAKAAKEEQQKLLSNTKTLYRQLARTHHPDLERDPETQAHKTVLMQRITEAYEANDLYTLLQLLSESGPAASADDDVLARYTQALQQQQIELKQQLNELKYGDTGFSGSTGKKREIELRELKRHLRAEAEYLEHIFRLIQEPVGLREVLRELSAAGHDTV
ncbi:J domain-containing protein [Hymenobacter sp. BT186]|uniref:J domain-containing protein n=1 Tax=Hymenobacter telluris TaxID=2816474 RepID=A0A939EVX1_9BACT|nr:J domain-containing protein [Hymenobacter telluris]MBO0358159.1 J domain-containing protein [Hymenobacter telluris]MBW3374186.1 J domain-containing protein [Hymenobacter norwichensis]